MPIKVNCKNIERIIKTDSSGQPTEIMKVYRNNAVVWTKKSADTSEMPTKMAKQLMYLINEERKKLGINQLYAVPHLNECAKIRAMEQVETVGHTRPNGAKFDTVIDREKVDWFYASENIALGSSSAEDAVSAWKSSTAHWSFAMNRNFTHTGAAIYYDENSTYKWNWVQIYINNIDPSTVYPDQYLPQNEDL